MGVGRRSVESFLDGMSFGSGSHRAGPAVRHIESIKVPARSAAAGLCCAPVPQCWPPIAETGERSRNRRSPSVLCGCCGRLETRARGGCHVPSTHGVDKRVYKGCTKGGQRVDKLGTKGGQRGVPERSGVVERGREGSRGGAGGGWGAPL